MLNRPDVDEIEVFSATVNDDFWSLSESVTGGASDFQVDAVMNCPDGRVYLFYGDYFIERDHEQIRAVVASFANDKLKQYTKIAGTAKNASPELRAAALGEIKTKLKTW
ncbi:MAG: hypothetical protein COA42_18525 [Alteromonadaceae bacterium]|nr:MAG: hypothetical protein COA42_18525 [Alteromonadaceae bacterium]